MPAADRVDLALPLEFSLRVLPDGFQHPVPVFTDHVDSTSDQALVEQRLERIDVGVCDRFGRSQRAAAREDGKRSEHASLIAVEELVGPADCGLERPLPLLDIAVARRKEPEPLA